MVVWKGNSAPALLLQREQLSLPAAGTGAGGWSNAAWASAWCCVSLPWRHQHLSHCWVSSALLQNPCRRPEMHPCTSRATSDLEDRAVHKNHQNRKIWRPHAMPSCFQENLLKLPSHSHGNSPLCKIKITEWGHVSKQSWFLFSPWFFFQGKTSLKNDRFLSNTSLMTNWHCHGGERSAGSFRGTLGTSICSSWAKIQHCWGWRT